MKLVEKHNIKLTHRSYKEIDNLSFKSKNLYNRANYVIRQEFIKENKYLGYKIIQKTLQSEDSYKALPSKVSQQVLKLLDRNWLSFFRSIKDWSKNKNKYKGRPKLPRYKNKKLGKNVLIYTDQCLSKKVFKKEGLIQLSGTGIKINSKIELSKINQVRIVPRNNSYVIEIIYESEEITNENKNLELDKNLFISLDLGLVNLATITSNKEGFKPLIINGRTLKSINQYYNKKKSKLQSFVGDKGKSKKIYRLTNKRNNKISDYLHKSSRYIINLCLENSIGTIVVGKNNHCKQEINIGSKNNQNFVCIPHSKFVEMIQYKAKLLGIDFILTEESYTSKSSFIDEDIIPVYKEGVINLHRFSGRRLKRGIYKSKLGYLINADVNGSLNIARKAFPEFNINNIKNGIEVIVVSPVRVDVYSLNKETYKQKIIEIFH